MVIVSRQSFQQASKQIVICFIFAHIQMDLMMDKTINSAISVEGISCEWEDKGKVKKSRRGWCHGNENNRDFFLPGFWPENCAVSKLVVMALSRCLKNSLGFPSRSAIRAAASWWDNTWKSWATEEGTFIPLWGFSIYMVMKLLLITFHAMCLTGG